MKLGEFIFLDHSLHELMDSLHDATGGDEPVRVEIHSLDDPPWPTERPEGWGVGWWCRVSGSDLLCIYEGAAVMGIDSISGTIVSIDVREITSFGPRAEVPR